METLPKRMFTAEFRSHAVKLVRESKLPQAEAARQLGISEQTLATGMKQARKGNTALFASGSVSGQEQEIARLKRELAEAPGGGGHPAIWDGNWPSMRFAWAGGARSRQQASSTIPIAEAGTRASITRPSCGNSACDRA